MGIEFVRVNKAVYYTVELFELNAIKPHTFRFMGKPNTSYLNDWHEFLYRLHREMEDDIQQTIAFNNKTAIVHLMELLDDWANDFRIKTVNMDEVERVAEEYNKQEYDTYVERVKMKVQEFMSTERYSRLNHLDSYDITYSHSTTGLTGKKSMVRAFGTYHKFYCITEDSNQIDLDVLRKEYKDYITPIVVNFRSILERYVRRYQEGKIDLPTFFSSQPPALPPPLTKLLEDSKEVKEKEEIQQLEMKISAGQLAFLFRLFDEIGLLKYDDKTNMMEFLFTHFKTKKEANDFKYFYNKYSVIETSSIKFWKDNLAEMQSVIFKKFKRANL